MKIELKTTRNGKDIDVSVVIHNKYEIDRSTHSSIHYVLSDYGFMGTPTNYTKLDYLKYLREAGEDVELVCGDDSLNIWCSDIPKWRREIKAWVKKGINQETGVGLWGMRFSTDNKLDKTKLENFLLTI